MYIYVRSGIIYSFNCSLIRFLLQIVTLSPQFAYSHKRLIYKGYQENFMIGTPQSHLNCGEIVLLYSQIGHILYLIYTQRRGKNMKKITKKCNLKGFTLIEMVLVIAIIVILAAVLVMGIGSYLNRAKNAASSLKSHNSSVSKVTSEIDHQTYS